jgi:hypothetical protein
MKIIGAVAIVFGASAAVFGALASMHGADFGPCLTIGISSGIMIGVGAVICFVD